MRRTNDTQYAQRKGLHTVMVGVLSYLCLAAVVGCGSGDREQLTQSVIEQDPAFISVLERRDTLEQQIGALRLQLDTERAQHKSQIQQLERAYRARRAGLRADVNELMQQLRPEEERLELTRETVAHRIRIQEATIRGLDQAVDDLEDSLEPESSMTPDRRRARQQELLARQAELKQNQTLLEQHQSQRKLLESKLQLIKLQ
jgi:chromosome segregation ATPase